MDFLGKAKRLDDIDLPKIGQQIGVGEDELHAVIDVESRGSGFDKKGRPIILFERHCFYRQLGKTPNRDKAVKQGLAVRRWSRATYNKDQYALLERAMKIDVTAALKSCSWGMFQVMGFNYATAGYSSVVEMVEAFKEDEENHLQAAVNFIKENGLDDDLREHRWASFAKGYNGPGYAQNKYDEKLSDSFTKWARIKDTPLPPVEVTPPKMRQIVEDAAAQDRMSTTEMAAGVTTVGGAVAIGKEVATVADEAKGLMDQLMAVGPWVLLGLALVGAGWLIWKERRRKKRSAREALA